MWGEGNNFSISHQKLIRTLRIVDSNKPHDRLVIEEMGLIQITLNLEL